MIRLFWPHVVITEGDNYLKLETEIRLKSEVDGKWYRLSFESSWEWRGEAVRDKYYLIDAFSDFNLKCANIKMTQKVLHDKIVDVLTPDKFKLDDFQYSDSALLYLLFMPVRDKDIEPKREWFNFEHDYKDVLEYWNDNKNNCLKNGATS